MTDETRLKDGDGLEALLLRAADDDEPSPASKRAIASALGLAPAIGAGTAAVVASKKAAAATATAKVGTSALALKISGVVLAVGASVGTQRIIASRAHHDAPTAVVEPRPAGTPARPEPSVDAPRITPGVAVAAPEPPAPARLAEVDAPRIAVTARAVAPTRVDAPKPHASVEASAPPPPPAPVAPAQSTLAAEVAALDAALAATRASDGARAIELLDTSDATCARGTLAPEALVARIQATLLIGDTTGAHALGERVFTQYPKSPLVRRVRELLEVR